MKPREGAAAGMPRPRHRRLVPIVASHTQTSIDTLPATSRRLRGLVRLFYLREIRTRYLGSSTGLAWALIHPIALLGVYWFVFTSVFRAVSFGPYHFLPFVAVALWPWLAAQEALSRATVSLASHAGLIRKAAFPQEAIVYASVTATFTLHLAGYVVVLVLLRLVGQPIRLEGLLLAVPLWIVLMIAMLGVSLALAALQVFMRDVEQVLVPVLMIFMYLTPILYPLTLVPEAVQPWVAANPFSWLVTRMRDVMLDGRLVLQAGDAVAIVVAFSMLGGGLWMFRRLAPHFEDFL